MSKTKNNQDGFSAVEIVMVLVILALIGVVGWMVQNHHKTTKSVASTSKAAQVKPKAPDPYAGWQSYTLKYEKLAFRYPVDWTIQDDSDSQGRTPNTDNVTLTAKNGFDISIDDGWNGGGDPLSFDTSSTLPVKFLGNSDYLVFSHPRQTGGSIKPNGSSFTGATVMTSLALNYSENNTVNSFPQDKNAHGDPSINNGGSTMLIGGGYYSPKTYATVSEAANDPEFKNFELVLQSAHY